MPKRWRKCYTADFKFTAGAYSRRLGQMRRSWGERGHRPVKLIDYASLRHACACVRNVCLCRLVLSQAGPSEKVLGVEDTSGRTIDIGGDLGKEDVGEAAYASAEMEAISGTEGGLESRNGWAIKSAAGGINGATVGYNNAEVWVGSARVVTLGDSCALHGIPSTRCTKVMNVAKVVNRFADSGRDDSARRDQASTDMDKYSRFLSYPQNVIQSLFFFAIESVWLKLYKATIKLLALWAIPDIFGFSVWDFKEHLLKCRQQIGSSALRLQKIFTTTIGDGAANRQGPPQILKLKKVKRSGNGPPLQKKAAEAPAASGSDVRAMELTPLPDTTPTTAAPKSCRKPEGANNDEKILSAEHWEQDCPSEARKSGKIPPAAERIAKKAAPNANRREAPEVAETTYFSIKGVRKTSGVSREKKELAPGIVASYTARKSRAQQADPSFDDGLHCFLNLLSAYPLVY
ncbi:hypothetical protein L1887_60351 [Cichorium endivia]|nr:hypothetical protein L1887_60351 [Cichorium endivia]